MRRRNQTRPKAWNRKLEVSHTSKTLHEEILGGIFNEIDLEDIFKLSSNKPNLLFKLLERRPSLVSDKSIWAGSEHDHRELLASLAKGKPLSKQSINNIVTVMLEAHIDGIAEDAYQYWGKDALYALLNWIDKSKSDKDIEVPLHWMRVLKRSSEDSLTWFSSTERPKPGKTIFR